MKKLIKKISGNIIPFMFFAIAGGLLYDTYLIYSKPRYGSGDGFGKISTQVTQIAISPQDTLTLYYGSASKIYSVNQIRQMKEGNIIYILQLGTIATAIVLSNDPNAEILVVYANNVFGTISDKRFEYFIKWQDLP